MLDKEGQSHQAEVSMEEAMALEDPSTAPRLIHFSMDVPKMQVIFPAIRELTASAMAQDLAPFRVDVEVVASDMMSDEVSCCHEEY